MAQKMVRYYSSFRSYGNFLLANDFEDLLNRLGKIIIGYDRDLTQLHARY